MSDDNCAIGMEIVTHLRSCRVEIKFTPHKDEVDNKWYMRVRHLHQKLVCVADIPMDDFLKVCLSFAADAEAYK